MNVQAVSDAVKEMGLELAQEYGIRALPVGEQRPDGYYSVGIYTGGALKKRAANPKKAHAAAPNRPAP
jgi:hypothetical protein